MSNALKLVAFDVEGDAVEAPQRRREAHHALDLPRVPAAVSKAIKGGVPHPYSWPSTYARLVADIDRWIDETLAVIAANVKAPSKGKIPDEVRSALGAKSVAVNKSALPAIRRVLTFLADVDDFRARRPKAIGLKEHETRNRLLKEKLYKRPEWRAFEAIDKRLWRATDEGKAATKKYESKDDRKQAKADRLREKYETDPVYRAKQIARAEANRLKAKEKLAEAQRLLATLNDV